MKILTDAPMFCAVAIRVIKEEEEILALMSASVTQQKHKKSPNGKQNLRSDQSEQEKCSHQKNLPALLSLFLSFGVC
jgi:hypothetical protein